MGGYDDLTSLRDRGGDHLTGDHRTGEHRPRTSVGDIMSGGELVRSREFLNVGEISLHPSGTSSPRGVLSASPVPRSSILSSRETPSPVRGVTTTARFRQDLDYDISSVDACYPPLGGSSGVTQHLLSGRDSIL